MAALTSEHTGLKIIRQWAPVNAQIVVGLREEGEDLRYRLYAIVKGRLYRIDQLLYEVVERLKAAPGGVSYYGHDHIDGSKTSGLRVRKPPQGAGLIARRIVHELAEIVHGDRKVWGYVQA